MTNACVGEINTQIFKLPEATWEKRIVHGVETTECSYCGSLSVEDVLKFLQQPGTMFSGCDWKYGWPHKYYIEPLNPEASKETPVGTSSHREDGTEADGTGPHEYWTCWAHGDHVNGFTCTCPKDKKTGIWHVAIMGKLAHLHYKFYNKHLADCDDETFNRFADVSFPLFGIRWGRDKKGIFYQAPKTNSFYGYQRAGYIQADGKVIHQL